MKEFDLIIIGTGSGNTIITPEFDDLSIAIVEKGTFGGTCLNRGCIPSKMLIYVADLVTEIARSRELGITTVDHLVNWRQIQQRIFGRIDPIANAGETYRHSLSNVTVFNGEGSFVSVNEIIIGDEIIRGKQIVIATGATPVLPKIAGLSNVEHHTSDTIMRIPELPSRLAIIGGGYIATELAHVFSSFGCEVVMLVRGNTLLPNEDISIQERFTQAFREKVDLRLETTVSELQQNSNGIQISFESEIINSLEVDTLLLATGRLPDLDSLNVKAANIETKDGYIVTDQCMRTTADNIWALGDVTNPAQLKHTANAEAKVISHNLISENLKEIDLDPIPHAIFSNPQVASVGSTEQILKATGIRYVTAIEEYSDVAYGWAMEETTGMCKVIADPRSGLLLGAHILGPQASTLIHQLIQGMKFGQTVAELASGFLYVHPALNEVVENALIKVATLCE
ncbi:MAG: mycothione reductase [Acidimicrobiaceae bacterium]|nr:mycothione reductase [Acidimicrobiaceae bacterium]|tara:strand:+ start:389 stop:1753 length:1365 start_codon:yes stop_codon:yes gene_type:complete